MKNPVAVGGGQIGMTFQPRPEDFIRRRLNAQSGQLGPMANEALRILSMRLPDILSGRPMAPSDLLRPRVGGAQTDILRPSMDGGPAGVMPMDPGGPNWTSGPAEPGRGIIDLIERAIGPSPGAPTITPGTPDMDRTRSNAPDNPMRRAAPRPEPRFPRQQDPF